MPVRGASQLSRPVLVFTALVTIAVYWAIVQAWRSDKPDIVTPANSAITTAVRAEIYPLQAAGFLKGKLHLDLEVPREMRDAKNPYDPQQRPKVFYPHDSSLYRGKYYSYFGPAPALLLFAPWRAIAGTDLPTPYAVFFCVSLAYLGWVALFRPLVRDAFPSASRTLQWAGIVALGFASMLLPLLRRPGVYEAAISCGAACLAWGLWAAWRARDARSPLRWASFCGALFGVAVAARPTFGLGALAAALLMLLEPGTLRLRWRLDRRLLAAAGAGTLFVAGLLLYNYARFDNPLEFGQKYQLSGAEEGAIQHFSHRFVPMQAWLYLFSPLRVMEYFPFLRIELPPQFPAGFGGQEFSFGLFTNFPFVWFVFAMPAALFFAPGRRGLFGVVLFGTVLAVIPLLFFFGSCVRYQAEFGPWLVLLAALSACQTEQWAAATRVRLVRVGAVLAAGFSAIVGLLAVVDMYNPADQTPPRTFDAVGRLLNRPVVAFNALRGRQHGPLEIVFTPGKTTERREILVLAQGPDGRRETLWVERIDPQRLRLIARREGEEDFEHAGEVETSPGRQHTLRVSLPAFYPVRPIEMPHFTSREDFRALKVWTRVECDGRNVIEVANTPVVWRTLHVTIAPPKEIVYDAAFTGRIVDHGLAEARRTAESAPIGGVRLRVTFSAEFVGRSFPLAVTGHQGRGNFLFVQVPRAGEIRLSYDHWGKPSISSPVVSVPFGTPSVIEFWMPSLRTDAEQKSVLVTVNGNKAWEVAVPYYLAGNQERFLARNPLGGSACESLFPGAVIESTTLPPPSK